MKACFMSDRADEGIDYVYGGGRRQMFEQRLDVLPNVITHNNLDANKEGLADVEVVLSTWGMPELSVAEITKYLPNLKLILYAAASVRYFAKPFLESGVRITSAFAAMALPVAEFTLSQIFQANKGYYHAMALYRAGSFAAGKEFATHVCPGTYNTKVGIIGAGGIGSLVIRYLKQHNSEVLVFDPFMSPEKARALGVEHSPLEKLFTECQTISNHLANNAQTVGMLNYDLFRRMSPTATFINTGRGAQVVESDLARAMREEPNRCALLDVTYPEPCPPEHEFWKLPNVFLTPHIAGYARQEVWSFPDLLLEELTRYSNGERLLYEVTPDMLPTMA